MTKGKTVVHINIDEIKIKDIQDVSVVITTKDNTKILYNKWYMTEQEEPVLDKIRAEIKQTVDEEQKYDEKWAIGLRYAIKIIDKYRGEDK